MPDINLVKPIAFPNYLTALQWNNAKRSQKGETPVNREERTDTYTKLMFWSLQIADYYYDTIYGS